MEAISYRTVLDGLFTSNGHIHLAQGIDEFSQILVNAVSTFVPCPVSKEIMVNSPLFHKDVLGQFGRVVVEQTAQSIHSLCNSRSERCI